MIYPPGLSISDDPDIFGDKIVWGRSTDYYYDIGLQEMVYPEGLFIYGHPAIYGTKIVSSRSRGYYDLDLQQYILVRVFLGEKPDIFEDSVVGRNYDAIGPITVNIFIWEPVCKQRQISDSGCAFTPKIYNDIVVWMDERNGNRDIYMAMIGGCCGDAEHPYPVGDLNHDCRVNIVDLAILASHWLECTAPECDSDEQPSPPPRR